jgi:serine/threonine protein kinase
VLDRVVAVKVINQPVTDDPQYLEALQREARLAASLDHPDITTVYDFQVEDGTAYIVMAFLLNSLDKHIRPEQPIPYRRASEIAIELSRGLAHAHTQGGIHRDIKPGNILLTSGWGGSARLSWWDRSTIL